MSSDSANTTSSYSDEADTDAQGYYANADSDYDEEHESGVKLRPISALRAKRVHDDDPPPLPRRKPHPFPSNPSMASAQNPISDLMATTFSKGFSILNQKHTEPAPKASKRSDRVPGAESKKAPGWAPDDEMTLARVLVGCSSRGQVHMPTFYERAHDALPETTNTQVYDKMRRMRSRYRQIRDDGTPEERFAFRTPHEAKLYSVWKQIWGFEGKDSQQTSAAREAGSSDDGEQNQHYLNNNNNNNYQYVNNQQSVHRGYSVEAQGRGSGHAVAEEKTPLSLGFPIELGTVAKRMKNVMEISRCPNAFPGLDGAEGRAIREKWRRLQIEELRLFCNKIDLLQDECRICLKKLEYSP